MTERHLDAALFLAVRQDDGRASQYSVAHALHTATVLMADGAPAGWSPERTLRGVKAR
ncbi:MAG TPA: hypothetical protein VEZ89_05285 [Rubrivivax sp.]|nr:hypothetical protein [Rubrivivax sp.]